jgi:hypothetical protein
MAGDCFYSKVLNRRDFLKTSGLVTAALTLEPLLGCAPTLKELRTDVAKINWDCNPTLPIPAEGCYIGGYRSGRFGFDNKVNYESYGKAAGKMPAFWDISIQKFGAVNDNFPTDKCNEMIRMGVIPGFKYGMEPLQAMKEIADGKKDGLIEKFAEKALIYGEPYLFNPFKEMNLQSKSYWNHGGEPPKLFIKAWRHMDDILKAVGANHNTIRAIHFFNAGGTLNAKMLPAEYYYPGDDVVDIISFTVCNRVGVGEPYADFKQLIEYDYNWARDKHPRKPLAILEMEHSNAPSQPRWISKTYKDIKNEFPAIKIVQWWESLRMPGYSWSDDQSFSNNPKSVEAMQEALSDPYFIGGPLPFLEKYRKT